MLSYTYIFCPIGGTQLGATNFNNVFSQVREEETKAGCYGDRITNGEGLLVIWDTTDGSSLVQVLGTKVSSSNNDRPEVE